MYETRLDFWTRRVHFGLASWLELKSGFPEQEPHCDRLEVLAGNQYVEPLLENNVFEPFPWETVFPFQDQDFDGIGEQMHWLKNEVEQYSEGPSPGQSELQDWNDAEYTLEQSNLDDWTG